MTVTRYCCPCCRVDGTKPGAAMMLEKLEALVGPLIVTSSYRCPKHNKEVHGEPGSLHMQGLAFDILVKDGPERLNILKTARTLGFGGFGIGKNFIHIDLRKNFAMWTYKNQ